MRAMRANFGIIAPFLLLGAPPLHAAPSPGEPIPITQAEIDICRNDTDTPVPGTPEWAAANTLNIKCATTGGRIISSNPAWRAARNLSQAADPHYLGDPFRIPAKYWADRRGRFITGTYLTRRGMKREYEAYAPLQATAPPPVILIPCYNCDGKVRQHYWEWAAEALAEAGYVVVVADTSDEGFLVFDKVKNNFGLDLANAEDALEFILSTKSAPTTRGDYFPWAEHVNRDQVGVTGVSGNGMIAFHLAHDPRVKAIAPWDAPAGTMIGMRYETQTIPVQETPANKPTLMLLAEFWSQPEPIKERNYRPISDDLPSFFQRRKYETYDQLVAQGTDVMKIVQRSSVHGETARAALIVDGDANTMGRFYGGLKGHPQPHSPFGEYSATYYTLAWFDRYLKGATDPAMARDAIRRLTADRFDESVDGFATGTGLYDPNKAMPDDPTSGNVAITIAGTPVRNLLSVFFSSSYVLEGGKLSCTEMRTGCR